MRVMRRVMRGTAVWPGVVLMGLLVFFSGLVPLLGEVSLSGEAPLLGESPLLVKSPRLEYYGEMGCSHCDLFKEKVLPAAIETAAAPGLQVEAEYFDILSKAGFERCEERLVRMGLEFSVFPVLIMGSNAYQGNSAVEAGLVEELVWFAERGEYLPARGIPGGGDDVAGVPVQGTGRGAGRGMALWPVFLAGLIDGVNPCAFATMLFFISWIALRGGSRRRMILAGSGFILGIFIAYLAMGYGLFFFLRAAGTMGSLRSLVKYIFAGLAFLFAFLSLRDALVIRRSGNVDAMVLKLPRGLKRRIQYLIRRAPEVHGDGGASGDGAGRMGQPLLLFGSLLITGAFVSFLEIACTGQIYFPTIAYMVQSGQGTSGTLYLLLYNGAFVLPLMGVSILVLAGGSRQGIGRWFQRHLAAGKAAAALLFFLLGGLILVV